MAIENLNAPLFCVPQITIERDSRVNNTQDDKLAQELSQLEEEMKSAQEEYLKRITLIEAKAKNENIVKDLEKKQKVVEKTYKQIKQTKKSNGSATADSGEKGFGRWLANAGTALKNIGKSFIGYDKNGKWNPEKCLKNVAITAAAIGATFIPVVGPAIGYGLLAAGVAGGVIGTVKGVKKLKKAKKSGDQMQIDAAQQDICGNAFIGITSAVGMRGVGKAFRTSSATAEAASSAASRSSIGGKCVEGASNFARDITVNAFRGTKHSVKSGATPTVTVFRSAKKNYNVKNQQLNNSLNKKLADIDSKIAAETNPAKKALLQEERQMLKANLDEYGQIGNTIKTKADYDKLSKDNMAQFNREYVQNAYNKNASGQYDINGTLVSKQEFLTFQKRVIRQQKALERELQSLIKAKENMMRNFAYRPSKHRATLDEYVSTTGVKRSIFKPSSWVKTKEMIAIGGKNPQRFSGILNSALFAPGSTPAKTLGEWVSPLHSGAMLYTVELTPEETQKQLDDMQIIINELSELKNKMTNAETIEEYNSAIEEYNQFIAAANGTQA